MCGRFTLYSDLAALAERFNFNHSSLPLLPNYNISPTQEVLTVTQGSNPSFEAQARFMKWGLIPPWAIDESIGKRMINARLETIASKPSFKDSFIYKRCLVLSDGFYEWPQKGVVKNPMFIQASDEKPFAFAAIWQTWKSNGRESIDSCSILTTSSKKSMSSIHHRMPVILNKRAEEKWLNKDLTNSVELSIIIAENIKEDLKASEVSTFVNSPLNNGEPCISPVVRLL
ncbi:MAG: SOS response-associated peptidase [Dehalococcoidia bacterium]